MPKLFTEYPVRGSLTSEDTIPVLRNGEECRVKTSTLLGVTPLAVVTQYVNPTGDDTTGDGSSGSPWKTIAKALSQIPKLVDQSYTINIANGTYAEGISLSDKTALGDNQISFIGNSGSMDSVVLSGTVNYPASQGAAGGTTTIFVSGTINARFVGLKTASSATGFDLYVRNRANVIVQNIHLHSGASIAIDVRDNSYLQMIDTITSDAATSCGIQVLLNSHCLFYNSGSPCTMSFIGPSSVTAFVGIRVAYNSTMIIPSPAGCNVTMSLQNVLHGIELGLQSAFNMFYFPSTLSIVNASTPANSLAVQATDQSSYETRNTTIWTHLTKGFVGNSLAYGEHDATGGTITMTSVTTPSSVGFGALWESF